jgi:methyl-accepting chemotaxis protein
MEGHIGNLAIASLSVISTITVAALVWEGADTLYMRIQGKISDYIERKINFNEAIWNNMENLKDNKRLVDKRLDGINESIEEINNSIDEMNKSITEMEGDIENMIETVHENSLHIESVDEFTNSLMDDKADNNSVRALSKHMSSYELRLKDIKSQLEKSKIDNAQNMVCIKDNLFATPIRCGKQKIDYSRPGVKRNSSSLASDSSDDF